MVATRSNRHSKAGGAVARAARRRRRPARTAAAAAVGPGGTQVWVGLVRVRPRPLHSMAGPFLVGVATWVVVCQHSMGRRRRRTGVGQGEGLRLRLWARMAHRVDLAARRCSRGQARSHTAGARHAACAQRPASALYRWPLLCSSQSDASVHCCLLQLASV